MNHVHLRSFPVLMAVALFGCAATSAGSDDASELPSDAPTLGAGGTKVERMTSLGSVRESLVTGAACGPTHPLGTQLGPEPDPWHQGEGTGPNGGPEPDPWTPNSRRIVPSADSNAGSTTTGPH